MRFYLFALALVAAPALSAPPCTVSGLPSITGKSYHVARGLLIASGALPTMQTQPDDITTRLSVSLGYSEIEGCSGSGVSACRFAWSTNGKPFSIITEGGKVRRLLCD